MVYSERHQPTDAIIRNATVSHKSRSDGKDHRVFSFACYIVRSVSGLKVYVIALVWSGVTVFLPLINNDIPIDTDVILTGIQRFVFIIALMLPFEIRDLQYDNLKLGTIPQRIGIKNTKVMGLLLLICFLALEFFKENLALNFKLVSIVIVLVTMLFVLFSTKEQGKYYSSFFVEGIAVLWLLVLVFVSYLG